MGKIEKIYTKADYEAAGCPADVVIPDDYTQIDKDAFNNTSITSIVIPDSVIKIGPNVFSHCSSFLRIKIPESIIELDSGVSRIVPLCKASSFRQKRSNSVTGHSTIACLFKASPFLTA